VLSYSVLFFRQTTNTKGIKSHFVRTPKLPALPPSSPEVSRPEMNGKDSMADGHPVIGNGSIDTHQNIEDHPKLTITDTVTGLTIILYPSFHSCFSLLWMHCFALTIGYLVVSLVLQINRFPVFYSLKEVVLVWLKDDLE
jgi:hypothetical protein